MSDVLKQVEEALERMPKLAQNLFESAIEAHSELAGKEDWEAFQGNREVLEQRCAAALTALRGLTWKPIAEMEAPEPTTCRVGRYLESGAWDMNDLRNGTYAAACGYTHFCRPILPTPPKREVE